MSAQSQREVVILNAALELPNGQRAAFLERACGEDAGLRRQVDALLEAYERADTKHQVQYRLIRDSEIEAASELASRVFDEFAAVEESVAGSEEFHRYASATALRKRHLADCVTLVAERQGRIIGMLHLRNGKHITMFFVEGSEQRQSVGSGLVLAAEAYACSRQPPVRALTIASTPNAVEAYHRMGFEPVGKERVHKGLRFVPMVRRMGPYAEDTVVPVPLHPL